jgi:hypothetical protein
MRSTVIRLAGYVDYGLLTALAIPILAIAPLLTHSGLPNTADGPAHLMRQVELNQAWEQGRFYIRWGTDLALGHGMPIFHYTPPLLYQATQFFHLTPLQPGHVPLYAPHLRTSSGSVGGCGARLCAL